MNQDFRWLVVVPPVGKCRVEALRIAKAVQQEYGGGTYVFDTRDVLSHIQSSLRSSEEATFLDWMNQNLVVKILEQRATHVLSLSMSPVDPYYLNLLRARGVFCVHWVLDDLRIADYWRGVISGYDLVVANQMGEISRECLQKRTAFRFLSLAADIAVSGAGALWDARSLDVAFVGEWSSYRMRVLEVLAAAGLSLGIQGEGWEKERGFLARSVLKHSEDSATNLYRYARMAVHLSLGQPPESGCEEPVSANVYNSIAMGAFAMVEQGPWNAESLDGLSIHEFLSPTDLLAKCLSLQQSGVQSEFMLANQQAIQREHNLNHRVRQLAGMLPT